MGGVGSVNKPKKEEKPVEFKDPTTIGSSIPGVPARPAKVTEKKTTAKDPKFSDVFWIAWDNLLPSMESAWKESKWKTKYDMVQILKNEIEKMRPEKK